MANQDGAKTTITARLHAHAAGDVSALDQLLPLALNISAATVSRDWSFARAWRHEELARSADADGPATT